MPAGVTIVNGQNTNAITVNYPLAAFSGSIAVAATLNNACGASAQRKITVKGVPATPAGITGTTVVCSNQFGVPYSIAPIPTATSYTWIGTPGSYISDGVVTSAGNSLTTSATSVTVNYGSTAGTLRARANNVCGVGAARSINILINCRLATDDTPIKLHIYPQPTNEWVTLKYNSIENQYCEMWITDIAGRSMLHERLSASIGENENLIDVSNLANGIYLVSLKMSNRELTGKMVKQ